MQNPARGERRHASAHGANLRRARGRDRRSRPRGDRGANAGRRCPSHRRSRGRRHRPPGDRCRRTLGVGAPLHRRCGARGRSPRGRAEEGLEGARAVAGPGPPARGEAGVGAGAGGLGRGQRAGALARPAGDRAPRRPPEGGPRLGGGGRVHAPRSGAGHRDRLAAAGARGAAPAGEEAPRAALPGSRAGARRGDGAGAGDAAVAPGAERPAAGGVAPAGARPDPGAGTAPPAGDRSPRGRSHQSPEPGRRRGLRAPDLRLHRAADDRRPAPDHARRSTATAALLGVLSAVRARAQRDRRDPLSRLRPRRRSGEAHGVPRADRTIALGVDGRSRRPGHRADRAGGA